MRSPMQRTREYFKKMGWASGITEHWNSYVKRRQDLFGFIDLIVLGPDMLIACQTTSTGHLAERVAKITAIPEAKAWLEAGGLILVMTWAKRGARGKRKTWEHKDRWVTLEDFAGVQFTAKEISDAESKVRSVRPL